MTRERNTGGLMAAPRWIVMCLGAYLLVDLFMLYLWNAAGQVFSIQGPADGALSLPVTVAALVNLCLCLMATRSFRAGAPMRPVWMLATVAAAAQALPGVVAQLRPAMAGSSRLSALLVAGPLRWVLLASAMVGVLRILRQFGFWVRPSTGDWAMFVIVCVFALCRVVEAGAGASWTSMVGHPLLCVLFLEAMLLRQSVLRMGNGPIARCWAAFVYAICLTGLSEVTLWVIPHYSHAWPVAMIGSLAQFTTTAIFALAPAYQLAAQSLATTAPEQRTANLATSVPATAR